MMKVWCHHGLVIAVLTRNEHCPPNVHMHTGSVKWDARFLFSFWHKGVRLWNVTPMRNEPNALVLEGLRLVLKQPTNLRRPRELWWASRRTLCLENQLWDVAAEEVVSPKDRRPAALPIQSARFDVQGNKTVLQFAGRTGPLEIAL